MELSFDAPHFGCKSDGHLLWPIRLLDLIRIPGANAFVINILNARATMKPQDQLDGNTSANAVTESTAAAGSHWDGKEEIMKHYIHYIYTEAIIHFPSTRPYSLTFTRRHSSQEKSKFYGSDLYFSSHISDVSSGKTIE